MNRRHWVHGQGNVSGVIPFAKLGAVYFSFLCASYEEYGGRSGFLVFRR